MITYNHIDQYENYDEYYSKYIEPMNTTLDDDKWREIFRDFEDAALPEFLYWYPLCQRLDFSIYDSKHKKGDALMGISFQNCSGDDSKNLLISPMLQAFQG